MRPNRYESSRVFAELKNIRERLPGNMTTYQSLVSYDTMLTNALSPIIRETTFMDALLLRVMGWQEKHFRRKVSFLPRKEVPRRIINFLIAEGPDARMKAFAAIHLDRGLRVEAVELFIKNCSDYEKACSASMGTTPEAIRAQEFVRASFEDCLGCSGSLTPIITEARFWLNVAAGFKQKLLEKYVRLCITTAQRDYTQFFDCSVKLDDLIQTYIIAASRAIDKCDYRQGVLTSHVQNWFYTARDSMSKTRERRHDSMDTIGFTELGTTTLDDTKVDLETVYALARAADPFGAARCFLQLQE